MRIVIVFFCIIFMSLGLTLEAQTQRIDTVIFGGKKILRVITEKGDTAYLDQLNEVSVSSKQQFASKEEYDKYMRYRRYAAIVYPYALEAMRIYHESKESTRGMTNRERKKFMKTLEKEMEDQFEEPLKKLTRTQGMILTKMIEKELDEPFYDVIKEIKGGWSAFYYNTTGRFYGYHLRDGYVRGEDVILDMVLDDYRLSVKK